MIPELRKRQIMIWDSIAAVVGVLLLQHFCASCTEIETIPYSTFERLLNDGQVAEVSVGAESIQGILTAPLPSGRRAFYTVRVDPQLADKLSVHGRDQARADRRMARNVLSWIIPAVIFYSIWMLIFLPLAEKQGIGGLTAAGKSRAKIHVDADTKVTLKDVAGVEQAKFEPEEVVAFLRDPGADGRLGARIPEGNLLVGPPGTGKMLLAWAVAGEAGAPLFSISGSELVELFVEVGATPSPRGETNKPTAPDNHAA